jgi:hypothetical protein
LVSVILQIQFPALLLQCSNATGQQLWISWKENENCSFYLVRKQANQKFKKGKMTWASNNGNQKKTTVADQFSTVF